MTLEQRVRPLVNDATPLGLVIISYNILLDRIHRAKLFCESGDVGAFSKMANAAREVLRTLMGSLDMQYDVSQNLMALYVYADKQIQEAVAKTDYSLICGACDILGSLLDSFRVVADSGIEREMQND